MDRACERPASEGNGGLLRHLVAAVPKKKGIVSRLKTQ